MIHTSSFAFIALRIVWEGNANFFYSSEFKLEWSTVKPLYIFLLLLLNNPLWRPQFFLSKEIWFLFIMTPMSTALFGFLTL